MAYWAGQQERLTVTPQGGLRQSCSHEARIEEAKCLLQDPDLEHRGILQLMKLYETGVLQVSLILAKHFKDKHLHREAAEWFRMAAENCDSGEAWYHLGLAYLAYGYQLPGDYDAKMCLQNAIDKGYLQAHVPLVNYYVMQLNFVQARAHARIAQQYGLMVSLEMLQSLDLAPQHPMFTVPTPHRFSIRFTPGRLTFLQASKQVKLYEVLRQRVEVTNCNDYQVCVTTGLIQRNTELYTLDIQPPYVLLEPRCSGIIEVILTPKYSTKVKESLNFQLLSNTASGIQVQSICLEVYGVQGDVLDFKEIACNDQLGHGGFGTVFKGTYHGQVVALKKVNCKSDKDEMSIQNEVAMLRNLQQINTVVQYFGVAYGLNEVYIVMELCQYGSFEKALKKYKDFICTEKYLIKSMYNVAKAMEILHEYDIAHQDLKLQNILVVSLNAEDEVVCKISDFGTTRSITYDEFMTTEVGSSVYKAPEISSQKYRKQVDVFSYGMTICAFLFQNEFQRMLEIRTIKGKKEIVCLADKPAWCPLLMWSIMLTCLAFNPDDRPSFQSIVCEIEKVMHEVFGRPFRPMALPP